MASRAFITGLAGTTLTDDEKSFFRDQKPWGFIIFKRNVKSSKQLKVLVEELRASVGSDAPVLIDQEGGRVQRLGPPDWPVYPPGAVYDGLYRENAKAGLAAAKLGARLIAHDLRQVGIDVDCLPLADVPTADGDAVIGDRAYGDTPEQVAAVAGAVADGLLEGGVLPVLKHIPGHGRATADSHHRLPVVETGKSELDRTDFEAFRPLKHLPMAMTAHVVFSAFDPIAPATTSATMVRDVIRGSIGFSGLLMSDDVSMNALSGSLAERSRAAFAAGCDIALHCNGNFDEMRQVAEASPELFGIAKQRADAALAVRRTPQPFDVAAERERFAAMIGGGKGVLTS